MDSFDLQFLAYHRQHPEVYAQFQNIAFRAIERGFKRLSADFIFHVIRWESGKGHELCLNNNFTAYYSRMFLKDHPTYSGFFEIRRSKAEQLMPRSEMQQEMFA
jgi:hypothetical protein